MVGTQFEEGGGGGNKVSQKKQARLSREVKYKTATICTM